jgi:hypothetical protein
MSFRVLFFFYIFPFLICTIFWSFRQLDRVHRKTVTTEFAAESCFRSLALLIKQIFNPLSYLKIHHRVHNSPSITPVYSKMNAFHPITPIFLRSILILSFHLSLGLLRSILHSGLVPNFCRHLSSPYAFCTTYRHRPLWVDRLNIW